MRDDSRSRSPKNLFTGCKCDEVLQSRLPIILNEVVAVSTQNRYSAMGSQATLINFSTLTGAGSRSFIFLFNGLINARLGTDLASKAAEHLNQTNISPLFGARTGRLVARASSCFCSSVSSSSFSRSAVRSCTVPDCKPQTEIST